MTSTFVLIFAVSSFLYTLDAYYSMVGKPYTCLNPFKIANDNQIKYMFNNWHQSYIEDIVADKGKSLFLT